MSRRYTTILYKDGPLWAVRRTQGFLVMLLWHEDRQTVVNNAKNLGWPTPRRCTQADNRICA